jgi:zinc protease
VPASIRRTWIVIASIDEEPSCAARDGMGEKEVAESKQYLIGSLPRQLETNSGIASFLQAEEFFGLGTDHDVRLPGLLAAVTLDQVNDIARALLDPARATCVVAGPYEGT